MKRYIKQILSTSAVAIAAVLVIPASFASAKKDEVTQKEQALQQEASNKDKPTSTSQSSQISDPSKKRPRTPNIFPLCTSLSEFLEGYHFQGDTLFSRKDNLLVALPMEKGGKWESYGFRGVRIKNFIKDDNRMLAYNSYWTGDGRMEPLVYYNFFYYSDDYGKTYTEIHPKIDGRDISDFLVCYIKYIHQLNDSGKLVMRVELYDFESYDGVEFCVSEDFGYTWASLPSTMKYKEMLFMSQTPDVFAITGVEYEDWRKICIEVTPDGGETWNKTVFEISADYNAQIRFNPEDENEIFVICYGANKFLYSKDCGKNWDEYPLDSDPYKMFPDLRSGVMSDPYHRGRYYKITSSSDKELEISTRALSVSNDYGENWMELYSETIEEYDPGFRYIVMRIRSDYVMLIGSDITVYRFDLHDDELSAVQEISVEGCEAAWEINDNLLKCNGSVAEIRIYNLNGYEVANVTENYVDTSILAPGVYIAIAFDDCGNMSNCFKFNR